MKCTNCGTENTADSNSCIRCASKLRGICGCWVKKKPYNCGQRKCPGTRLFLIEIKELKS